VPVCESSLAQHFFWFVLPPFAVDHITSQWNPFRYLFLCTRESLFISLFLPPKIGYCMLACLSYTRTIWYHTPTSRYPLERRGSKIKKFVGCKFTHLREMDKNLFENEFATGQFYCPYGQVPLVAI
jgi:hypothetical protein